MSIRDEPAVAVVEWTLPNSSKGHSIRNLHERALTISEAVP
jgi:hypothetical protein